MGTLRRPVLRPLRAVALPVLAAVLTLGNHRCYDEHWSDRDELRGREWVLQVFQHEDGSTTVPKDEVFTLEFEDDESVSVRADCNRCSGSYDASGSLRLRISALACTRAFCGETAPFDTEYVQQLNDANTYFLEGRILTIHTDDGVLIFDR